MADFLSTSGVTYRLEEIIKRTQEKLILVSPYLKFNDRMKHLIEEKNNEYIDIIIVFGKNEMSEDVQDWLKKLMRVEVRYCQNLHAKCYLNETSCIITSLNLYEYSQVNNYEMGIYVNINDDKQIYDDTLEEVNRIINASKLIEIPRERIPTYQLAKKNNMTTTQLLDEFLMQEYLILDEKNKEHLTEKGKNAGGKFMPNKNGGYILWDKDMKI